MRDRRIWTADESCTPFHLEMNVAATDRLMGRFRVPSGNVGVIRNIASQMGTFSIKSVQRILIRPSGSDPTDSILCIGLHGSLTNVEELDTTGSTQTGLNSSGLAFHTGGISTPSCIVLLPDLYDVVRVGATGNVMLILFGWTFPRVDRS